MFVPNAFAGCIIEPLFKAQLLIVETTPFTKTSEATLEIIDQGPRRESFFAFAVEPGSEEDVVVDSGRRLVWTIGKVRLLQQVSGRKCEPTSQNKLEHSRNGLPQSWRDDLVEESQSHA